MYRKFKSEDIVDTISKLNLASFFNQSELLSNFSRLKTDEERVIFIREHTPLKDDFLTPVTFMVQKSAEKAVNLKCKGNEAFKKKDFKSAINFYSESIALAPYLTTTDVRSEHAATIDTEGQTVLSVAAANRSAALYELKKYESCLKDISFAIEMNYPESLIYKLHTRRANCLQALGKHENVIDALEMAFQSLTLTDITETKKDSIRSELESLRKSASSTVNSNINDSKNYVHLKPSYGQNSVLSNCSDCVEVKRTDNMGRGLFATRDIKIGDVIMVQKPFAVVVSNDYIYTNCHNCCKECSTLIPCPYCSLAMFCSKDCREIAWQKYHNVECKLLPVLQNIQLQPSAIRSLKTVITAFSMFKSRTEFYDTVKLFDTHRNSDDWHTPTDVKAQYNDYYQVYKSMKAELPIQYLFANCMLGTYLCLILEKETDFFSVQNLGTEAENFDIEQFKIFVACLLMRHLQNPSHEVCNLKDKNDMAPFDLNIIAETVCPLPINLINHSCDPNVVEYTVVDNQIAVRAWKHIRKGDQIFSSYGPVFANNPREARQAHLLQVFHFTCYCIACTENWPIYEVLEKKDIMIKCESCKIELCKVSPENFVAAKICESCNYSNNTLSAAAKLSTFAKKIAEVEDIKAEAFFEDIVCLIDLINLHLVTPTTDLLCMYTNLQKHFCFTAFDEEY